MEYAKDEIFSIQYNEETNTLEFGTRTSFWKKFWSKNKILKIIVIMTVILSVSNVVCIYNFYSLLSNL